MRTSNEKPPGKAAGKLDEFINTLTKTNSTPESGNTAEGLNDKVENTIQRILSQIEKGDATKEGWSQVKEIFGAVATSDTKQLREELDKLTNFENKVIDNTSPQNRPIERVTDTSGNLTDKVKNALGTPDAKTLNDLTDAQRFRLDQILEAQSTTQEIPSEIREAVTRITDEVTSLK